jgi:acetyl esterase/lipase
LRKRTVAVAVTIAVVILALFAFLNLNQPPINSLDSALLPETSSCTVQTEVAYLNDSNPYHKLDVYLPNSPGPFPAIIYIHGGGWVQGNKSDLSDVAQVYAKRGIAGFSIDYTLAKVNQTAWPQNIDDVIAALSYIKQNAATYHIDPNRIAVLGSSAGAQLASLVGTLQGNEPFLTNTSLSGPIHSQVCLVMNYDGVEDLEYVGQNSTENLNLLINIVGNQFGGVTYNQSASLWREASPVTYMAAGDPAFVFVHGAEDRIVPIQVAQSFNSKLQTAGVTTHFIQIEAYHDILDNEAINLQARYTLDPLLKQAFKIQ